MTDAPPRPTHEELTARAQAVWATLAAAGAERWTDGDFHNFMAALHQYRVIATPTSPKPGTAEWLAEVGGGLWESDAEVDEFLADLRRRKYPGG